MSNSSHPFDYLETLGQSASLYSAQPPAEQTDLSYWQGVGFLLDGQHYMVQVGSISEILPVPQTTPLPGVHRWVRGLANVRGRLIPVVSLGDFLKSNQGHYVSSQPNHKNRILVIGKKDIAVGLIVDEVKGIQQFTVNSHSDEIPATIPESIHPFTRGSYFKDQHYVVFSIEGLVTNERFLKAASE